MLIVMLCHDTQGFTTPSNIYSSNKYQTQRQLGTETRSSVYVQQFTKTNNKAVSEQQISSIMSMSQSSSDETSNNMAISHANLANKKILVVGGSGRVGGSVVCQLTLHNARVTVGGTKVDSFEESRMRWKNLFPGTEMAKKLDAIAFQSLNREDVSSVDSVLQSANDSNDAFDLVIHTAGPFQGKVLSPNGIIAACVENGVGYIDVCDDYCTATAAKTKCK